MAEYLFPFEKLEDLYGKEIGILQGLSIGDEFDTAIREKLLTMQKVSSYEQNITKLLLGRIDLTIAPGPTFQTLIKEMGLSDRIVRLSHPVAVPRPLHIVFSKTADFPNKDDAIKTMGKTLQDMADRGELDKITQKYGYSYKP